MILNCAIRVLPNGKIIPSLKFSYERYSVQLRYFMQRRRDCGQCPQLITRRATARAVVCDRSIHRGWRRETLPATVQLFHNWSPNRYTLLAILLSGLEAELYYVREGVVNTYAMNFVVPVPANIADLEFSWQSLVGHPVCIFTRGTISNGGCLERSCLHITILTSI